MYQSVAIGWGRKLRQLRKDKGLTQVELAAKTGITRASLSQYENDEVEIPATRLITIARALGVPITDITGEPPSAENIISAIKKIDFEVLTNLLTERGFSANLLKLVQIMHDKELEPWQIEAIQAILDKAKQKPPGET